MTFIIGSPQTFTDADDPVAMEFLEIVCDIPAVPEYQQLKQYRHHYGTTRYQHCLNVAWYSYIWCRKEGLNYRSAARGAMLHDFYLYDQHTEHRGPHADTHPGEALATARKYFEIDPVMEDCIISHMWPQGPSKPRTREGMIVSAADKYCASMEFSSFLLQKTKHTRKED